MLRTFRFMNQHQPAPDQCTGPFAAPESHTQAQGTQRHVPFSRKSLDALLLSNYGAHDPKRLQWSRFLDALSRVQRAQISWNWDLLSELYEPFDPDQTYLAESHETDQRDAQERLEIFVRQFEDSIQRANFQAIEFDVVQHAVRTRNDQKLQYEPNFQVFDELRVYGRGLCTVERPRRSWRKGFRTEFRKHAAWHRLIVMVKFRETAELGPLIKPDRVYLRLFKEVAFRELEMHLPEQATKLRMPLLDRFSIASPILLGAPTLALKIFTAASWLNPVVLGTVLTGSVSSGWKSFAGFRNARLKHTHQMISNLFYLTQANNRQCLTRVLEMAWEQETMEAALAFKILHDAADRNEPMDAARLDAAVERFVEQNRHVRLDFQDQDALDKLKRLGLVRQNGNLLEVVPLDEGRQKLRDLWGKMSP